MSNNANKGLVKRTILVSVLSWALSPTLILHPSEGSGLPEAIEATFFWGLGLGTFKEAWKMWRKAMEGLLRRTASPSSSSNKSMTPPNGQNIAKSKSSPFKQKFTATKAVETKSLFQIPKINPSQYLTTVEASMASMVSNMKRASISGTTNFKSCWNKSWSQYKFEAPKGSRQTHFNAIRSNIMQKYGSLGNSILLILSAVATDAVFWWLAELLLDDGMWQGAPSPLFYNNVFDQSNPNKAS